MSKHSFFNGALILMFSGFIVKILGFFYRIYLSNLLGAQGMGVFSLITPVYSLVLITLTSGLSITVSSMVSYEFTKSNSGNAKKITNLSMGILFVFSILVSIILYVFLEAIVTKLLKDNRTFLPLLIFIPSLPFITISASLKGYFYGISNVTPNAIAQIIEQLVRIISVIFLVKAVPCISITYACTFAMLGMILSELSNFFVLLCFYLKNKVTNKVSNTFKKRTTIKSIIILSSSISFNKLITSLLSTIETVFIPSKLMLFGLSYQESISLFGKISGMAMPLILFPSLVTNSLATTLIPAISEGLAKKNYKLINTRISKSIQLSLGMGFMFMVTFMIFPSEIGSFIYKKENISTLLYMLSFSCPLVYLNQILLGILNGLNEQKFSLITSIICYSIRILFVFLIIPKLGLSSYILGFITSLAINCVLNLAIIIKHTGLIINLKNWIFKPSIISILMLIISTYTKSFFVMLNFNHNITTILTVGFSMTIFCILMILAQVFPLDEIFRILRLKRNKLE